MDGRPCAIEMGFADELLTGERNPAFNDKPDESDDDDDDEVESPDEPDEDDEDEDPKRQMFPPKNAGQGTVFSRRAAEQKLVAHLTATASPPLSKPVRPPRPTVTPAVPVGRRVLDLYAELINQPH